MASSLSRFLSSTRAVCLRNKSTVIPFTIVLGNPSADLDSFISAVVYAYFHSGFFRNESVKRLFIPVLNLPTTPARDLWRLRPEFGIALKLAQEPDAEQDTSDVCKDDNNRRLLEQLVTIADIRSSSKSTPVSLFSESSARISPASSKKDDYVIVDHNVLSIPTYSMEHLEQHIKITGCIDHHVDESFVPSSASPRIIKTGIGSCASLVVQHLHDSRLWPVPDDEFITEELARLALAPILIDTANLTAKDKVSDTDRHAVEFLESFIPSSETSNSSFGEQEWNRQSFYDDIATTKANSLNLLTLSEIFERDYKEWTESTKEGEKLDIGVSSILKPITWLLQKAESVEEFLNQVHSVAHGSKHDLALFGIMTTSTSEGGDFRRELFVTASGATASKALKEFEAKITKELHLEPWNGSSELLGSMKARMSGKNGASYIWWQRDVAKSRKQVAPLLRDMVKEC